MIEKDEATLSCEIDYTVFRFRNHVIRFQAPYSLERYTDSCTNSIVQIGNNHGGHITLISGTEKQLIAYLNSILDGKMNLYSSLLKFI